jgi:hypothetical protein
MPTSPEIGSAHALTLAEARRLHRLSLRGSLASTLPVLRRLIRAGLFPTLSLPELHRQRGSIRRKHILRMLAIESGYRSWEEFLPMLESAARTDLPFTENSRIDPSQLNLWFSSLDLAVRFTREYGGEAVSVGPQAVVLLTTRPGFLVGDRGSSAQ